jgi:Uncharacterized conserved protein
MASENFDLRIIEPKYDSNIVDLIIDLEHLRKRELLGTTILPVFTQIKKLFHFVESVGSARIEGNHTTVADYLDSKEEHQTRTDVIQEIDNVDSALTFIEDVFKKSPQTPINRALISELHKHAVANLALPPLGEGDRTPGEYRKENVKILGTSHVPMDAAHVDAAMEELCNFINEEDRPKNHLLKIAIAHHRFVWIHPFTNGNGRVVRLLTYAMLVKLGFNITEGRILNPTAVFCNQRDLYYQYLAQADSGRDEDLLTWCEYVLGGIKEEIEKVDRLLDYRYLAENVLYPAVAYVLKRRMITPIEAGILTIAVDKQRIKNSDVRETHRGTQLSSQDVTKHLANLVERKMLQPEEEKGRKYHICLFNTHLVRGILKQLDQLGFLP